jgi:hypothetical protein
MTDLALTDALSDTSEQFDQRKNLRPWPRGVSGNPGGLRSNGKRYRALYQAQEAALVDHHGRPLSPREALLLDELVDLKLRKPRDMQDTVKRANAISRLSEKLYGAARPAALEPDIHDYVAAKAAEKAGA